MPSLDNQLRKIGSNKACPACYRDSHRFVSFTGYISYMKGIILAGGTGSRLFPLTMGTNKHLLSIFDKPMIYYPIATLMLAGIQELVIVSTPEYLDSYKKLLGDGTNFGVSIEYFIQNEPDGIPNVFPIVQTSIAGEKSALILGDNIFHGINLGQNLVRYKEVVGAQIFSYRVSNPSDYGIVELDHAGEVIDLVEKPKSPKSNLAIPGLYFFDETVIERSQKLEKSKRGEFEITDLLKSYLNDGKLKVELISRGSTWMDAGTPAALHEASSYVRVVEERQGLKIACLEEVALRNGWLTYIHFEKIISEMPKSLYRDYLINVLDSK